MKFTEKVVGTSFRFKEQGHKSYKDFKGHWQVKLTKDDIQDQVILSYLDDTNELPDRVPIRTGVAYLLPEPQNKYDPNAILVVAQLNNGHAFKLGYLRKGSNLYNLITQKTRVKLIMYGYSEVGVYSDSYEVEVDLNNI